MIRKSIAIEKRHHSTITKYLEENINDFEPIIIKDEYITLELHPDLIDDKRYIEIKLSLKSIDEDGYTTTRNISSVRSEVLEFVDGLYFNIKNHNIKVYSDISLNEKIDYLINVKRKFIIERIKTEPNYVYEMVSYNSFSDYLEKLEIVYGLLMQKDITDKFTYEDEELKFIKNKFRYFGYDEETIAPDSIKDADAVYEHLLCVLTGALFKRGRKKKINKKEIDIYFDTCIAIYTSDLARKYK